MRSGTLRLKKGVLALQVVPHILFPYITVSKGCVYSLLPFLIRNPLETRVIVDLVRCSNNLNQEFSRLGRACYETSKQPVLVEGKYMFPFNPNQKSMP